MNVIVEIGTHRPMMPDCNDRGEYGFRPLGERAPEHLRDTGAVESLLLTPTDLARLDLGAGAGEDEVCHHAHVVLGEMAWLCDVPSGSGIRITRKGKMVVIATDAAWLRAQASAWAKRQRAEGFLPVIATGKDGRLRTVSVRWDDLPLQLVDATWALRRVQEHFPGTTAIEVL